MQRNVSDQATGTLFIYLVLGCMLLAVIILAILVAGLVIVRMIYCMMNRGTSIFTYDDTSILTPRKKKQSMLLFLLLVLFPPLTGN